MKYSLQFLFLVVFVSCVGFSQSPSSKPTQKNSSEKIKKEELLSTPEASETKTSDSALAETKDQGLLGPFLAGPVVTVLGFPTPFRFGLEAKYSRLMALSFDWGFFPKLTFSNIKVNYSSWRIAGRIHPFEGAFFLGMGFGKQSLTAALTADISAVTVNYSMDVSTTILTPHLGWRWLWSNGFFLGMEVGVQLAPSSTATLTTDAPVSVQATADYQTNKTSIEDKANTFGQTTLPHFAFLQLGYLF